MHDDDRRRRMLDPVPVAPSLEWATALESLVIVLTAGGIFLTLAGAFVRPLAGGRRSTRLQWEERAREATGAATKER
jgi:hypothetical protein